MIWAVLLIGATVAFYVAVARHLKRAANPKPRTGCQHPTWERCRDCWERIT
jgi:hypothetical protein